MFRCVDEYFLLLWKKNTAKESGQKISIANKGTVSFIAEVEACVEYNFVMEYVENDIMHQVWTSAVANRGSKSIQFIKSNRLFLFLKLNGFKK